MPKVFKIAELAHCQTVSIDGVVLNIYAQNKHPDGEYDEWELCVENEHGVKSVWFEWFNCPQQAIETALATLAQEGPEDFNSQMNFANARDH